MSTTPVRVVLIGLPASSSFIPDEIRPFVEKSLAQASTLMSDEGFHYTFLTTGPDEGAAALGPKLEAERPDIVIIGNGIRSTMALTHFLEQIIDVVRTSAPQAKLGFNTVPQDSVDVVKRWFPTAVQN